MNVSIETLDHLSDRSLAGDSTAQNALFQALYVRFLPIAKRRVQRDHAEDLVQDTLKIVFDRYGQRNQGHGILVWGLTVLRNVIGNHYQAKQREKERLDFVDDYPAAAAEPANVLEAQDLAETREALLTAITELADRFPRCGYIFRALLTSLEAGGSANQISTRALEVVQKQQPGLTRGSFYTALHRCRGHLRRLLDQAEKGAHHV